MDKTKIINRIVKEILSEAPGDDLPKVDKSGKAKVGDVKISNGIKSTITDIDKITGAIKWKIDYLPNFDKLFDDVTDLVGTAKGVYTKAKDDDVLRVIYDESRLLRNKIRTHIRNEYPEEYRRITMSEGELEEMSTTGGGAGSATFTPGTGMQYATPYAFNKNKKAKGTDDDIYTKEFGYKLVKENGGIPSRMVALPNPQQVEDQLADLAQAISREEFAMKVIYELPYKLKKDILSHMQRIFTQKEGIGADLGPGPKASEDGVKDNSYVKEFGYKLVPSKIKGSGLEVKQLFEAAESSDDFQGGRLKAFDRIEQEINDIYKMLSNAKNETAEYYKENPGSYSVVKPTDLVLDYIKDIKDLLKGE
tara:strand:- start:883 stop:1974 length:1092 start_codon:yes stop_codon:yes gene_type:complete